MTTSADGLLRQLVAWARDCADGARGRRAAARWATARPALAAFPSVGALVRAAWADPATAASVLADLAHLSASGDLFRLSPGDVELAGQAALAIVAPRLLLVVGRWARAGVPAVDLEDMAAELVAEVLAVLRTSPDPRPPGAVVDLAWGRVRRGRGRERRQAARRTALDPAASAAPSAAGEPGEVAPLVAAAGVVVEGFRSGLLSLPAAQVLWATGVAGWPGTEAAVLLGCGHEALRARRSRAIRALTLPALAA